MTLVLVATALTLTYAMFAFKQSMLGFPSAMFWAMLGGWSYSLSVMTWDIYYFLFFASLFGMTIFCVLAAFGLRRKDLEPSSFDTGRYIDEGGRNRSKKPAAAAPKEDNFWGEDDDDVEKPYPVSPRTQALRDRAAKRKSKYVSR